ncbi:hypothetical protein LTR53_008017 [Teratosphaeriaceae sp. CCFEE 6253]|nr:hypothetical protein LTR53_008017 [Teratosphaeriaceae sp. CCFEE 6253]
MAPISVHIDDPVTPVKPQGVTPQTAAIDAPLVVSPANNSATATSAPQPLPYPAAKPGAAATPAPTPYLPSVQPTATRTTTTTYNENAPPPPQPGAVPSPLPQQAPMTVGSGLPPPPRPGESVKQGSAFTGALNNMYALPPAQKLQTNYAPTHSTYTAGTLPGSATAPQLLSPTTLNFGPVASPTVGGSSSSSYPDASRRISSKHPPGYVQNVYAQDLSPAARASLDQETRRESLADRMGFARGGEAGSAGERGVGESVNEAWDAAKGWFNKAGAAIAEGEQEVWRRINGGH